MRKVLRSECGHAWRVFAVAEEEGRLIAECIRCGLHGTLDVRSKSELMEKRPFAADPSRVTPHPESVSPRTYWRAAYREWWVRLFPAASGAIAK
jgi:hypothetical protein